MMPLTEQEIASLRCPCCVGALDAVGGALTCGSCERTYELGDRGADLLPWSGGEPGPEWSRWNEKLALLNEWRKSAWDESPAADGRQKVADDLAGEFFRFLDVPEGGSVLEIGCGDGQLRSHLPSRRYWGLDPDPGTAASGDVARAVMIRGVGEQLPLADGLFDAVLLCQTLDHCRDPSRVLREAQRVLRPGGIVGVMQSLCAEVPVSPLPLRARIRVRLGRVKARLLGRRRIDDAETKTVPLDREAVFSLVQPVLAMDDSVMRGQVLFVRARRVGSE